MESAWRLAGGSGFGRNAASKLTWPAVAARTSADAKSRAFDAAVDVNEHRKGIPVPGNLLEWRDPLGRGVTVPATQMMLPFQPRPNTR